MGQQWAHWGGGAALGCSPCSPSRSKGTPNLGTGRRGRKGRQQLGGWGGGMLTGAARWSLPVISMVAGLGASGPGGGEGGPGVACWGARGSGFRHPQPAGVYLAWGGGGGGDSAKPAVGGWGWRGRG